MFNHTPEPWRIEKKEHFFETGIATDAHLIAEVKHYSDEEREFTRGERVDVYFTEGHANALRIVQCVNALAGIEDVEAFVKKAKKLMEAANA
jgi:hypothetical protein